MKFLKRNTEMQQSAEHQTRRFTLGQYIVAVCTFLLTVTAISYAAVPLILQEFKGGSTILAADVNEHFKKINAELVAMTNAMNNPAVGTVVQMKSVQTRDIGTYVTHTNGVNAPGMEITPLNIVITPRKAGNAMVLEWHVNGECSENVVYIVQRNGGLLADTTDGANNRWAGLAAQPYDANNASTPDNAILRITDYNTLATSTTYTLHIRSSNATAPTLYLNRTAITPAIDSYETSLSSGTATEIAQ